MKLYRNWIINEVARAGEHTNERTYVRTYSHTYVRDRPYIPSTTLLCEGIIIKINIFLVGEGARVSDFFFTKTSNLKKNLGGGGGGQGEEGGGIDRWTDEEQAKVAQVGGITMHLCTSYVPDKFNL